MTRTIRAAALIAVLALMGAAGFRSPAADADSIAGQYSMEVAVAETSVAVNGQFAAYAGIYGGGAYQGAQWHIDYPETIVDVVSMGKDPGAPSDCVASSDDGTRVLLGCIRVDQSSQLTFSGNAWIVGFKCIANGTANITLASGAGVASPTGVLDSNGVDLAMHTHSDTVTCGGGGPPPPPTGDQCTVSEVLTGDSFKCSDGKTVRLLQIDAQDLNQCGGGWAKAALQYIFLTPGRVVTLDYDATKTGGGGVTLAAPIARGTDGYDYNISIVMVYVGLAKAANFGDGNVKFLDWANASQTWASVAKWNMWAPGKTYTGGCD